MPKHLSELELADFDAHPVWSSDIAGCDEESVEPRPELTSIPVNVHGLWVRFVGALNDRTPVAGIAMAQCPPTELLAHSFFIEGEWYTVHFPPAPDFVLAEDGPARFADRLGRALEAVFPIRIQTEITAELTGKTIEQTLTVTGPAA